MLACFDLTKVLGSVSPKQRTAKIVDSQSIRFHPSWLTSLELAPSAGSLVTLNTSPISSSGSNTSSHASQPSVEMLTTNIPSLSLDSQSIASPLLDSGLAPPPDPADDHANSNDGRGADVEDILWEAQMGFVNHKLGLAIDRFTTAARLGSSAACLSLASLCLAQVGHQASPASSAGKASALNASTKSFFRPPHQSISPQLHNRLSTGARWAITGLQYQLDRNRPSRSPSWPSRAEENPCSSIDLNLLFDLISLLLSVYCHGKISPPPDSPSCPASQPCLWNDGAAIALRLLNHPLFSPTFDATSPSSSALISAPSGPPLASAFPSVSPRPNRSQTVSTPTLSHSISRSLSQDTKIIRTIVVQCAYLLALARWPFSRPSPELSPSTPNLTSPCPHWGQAQARQLWFMIIGISELPGGIGTRAGDAIVEKAYQRLNALERPRSPLTIPSSPPPRPYRHCRHISMLPSIPAPLANPVLSSRPANLHRSSTFPNLCFSRLASVLGRPSSIRSVQTHTGDVGMSHFFLGYRQGSKLNSISAPAIPSITLDACCTPSFFPHTPPPGSDSSTSLSVEERLQRALVADEEARLMDRFDWGVEDEQDEEEEGEGDREWEVNKPDTERLVVPVGMDPVLRALEAESRLNVEADCAVCELPCTNSPTCPKCGLVFCSRACRTIACTRGRHAQCGGGRKMASVSDLSSLTSLAVDE